MGLVRFGVFDFDVETGELCRQGRRVHLTAQAATVLTLLVRRRGDVVTRDELKRALWSGRTFVEFDRSLNFCLSSVRAALGDTARSPRFIETLPRRGYRFVAEVVVVDPPRPVVECDDRGVDRRRVDRRVVAAVAVLLMAVQRPAFPLAHTRETARPEAREAFVRALQTSGHGDVARRRGIAGLHAAVRIDPQFAEAHYALADLYLDLAIKRELPVTPALAEAESAARRALTLEEVAETRLVLGLVRLLAAWDWTAARAEIGRAVALAPKWDIGLASYARVLSAVGDDEGAIAAIDKAEAISPSCDVILFDAGTIYARAGRLGVAAWKLRRAMDVGPPRTVAPRQWVTDVQLRLLRIAVVRGDWTAARDAAAAILAATGEAADVQRRFAAQDPRLAVERFLRRSIENMAAASGTGTSPTRMATFYALLGEPEKALEWLEAAAIERDPELVYALRDPDFNALRGRPRYDALERRVHGS